MPPSDLFTATLQEWVALFMRRSMRSFIQYARESGFSMSQISALFHIRREGGCGVTDLGENLGITSAAASQMLERLVQQGLILRSEDPVDRRVKKLYLTEPGNQIIHDGIHARQGWLNELGGLMTEDEKAQVTAALQILIEKARLLDQEPIGQLG